MSFHQLPRLFGLHFFSIEYVLHHYDEKGLLKKKFLLPSTADYLGEDHFADLYFGWNEKGLYFHVLVQKEYEEGDEQDYKKGDSIECFIDTRDMKNKSFISSFCHHFVFFKDKGKEITRFRTEDIHTLCDPTQLEVSSSFTPKSYATHIFIPQSSLFGYEPENFHRLGFTYRINRKNGTPQHFSVSSLEYNIEQHPSFFASLTLKKDK